MLAATIALLAATQGWQTQDIPMQMVIDRGKPAREAAVPVLMPEASEGPLPVLTCDKGKVGLFLVLDRADPMRELTQQLQPKRNIHGRLLVEGKEVGDGRFPRLSRHLAKVDSHSAAAKVYNAAIKGERVEFAMQGRGRTPVTLPPVDDTFRQFAARCAAQRG